MKKLSILAVSVLTVCTAAISCKDGQETAEIRPTVTSAGYEGFTIDFAPSAGVADIEYAVCPLASAGDGALAAFEAGSLSGIVTARASDGPVTAAADSVGPYVVYARGVTSSGIKGTTCGIPAMAAPAGMMIEDFNSILINAGYYAFDEKYAGIGVLVASKIVLQQIGMSMTEIVELYLESGMIPLSEPGSMVTVPLNGEPGYEYYIGLVATDNSGAMLENMYFTFFAPEFDETLALPEKVGVQVSEIADNSARIVCTMGANTCAYYQALMTRADYDKVLSGGGSDPEGYLRDYVAFYGVFMSENDDYVWPDLPSGTDMVFVCYPMNGNGIKGYGEKTEVAFTTGGTAVSASSYGHMRKISAPVTAETVRNLM